MKVKRAVLAILLVVICTYRLEGLALSDGNRAQYGNAALMYSMKDQSGSHNGEVETATSGSLYIPGDYLKAAMVAGRVFQENLDKKWRNNSSPVAPHLSDISNYSIAISREAKGGQYKVEFYPKPFQDSPIKGGGATYVVDSKSFKILRKDYSM